MSEKRHAALYRLRLQAVFSETQDRAAGKVLQPLSALPEGVGGGGAFAYIKFIKPRQGAKVSADPDDYEFEDEEYENEDVPEQGEQEDQN